MSVDDNDPRHLTAARAVLSAATERLAKHILANQRLVTDNDALRARVAELEAQLSGAETCLRLQRDEVSELEADQRRHLEAIASEARCLGHLRTNLDEKQTRIATMERQLAAAREKVERGAALVKSTEAMWSCQVKQNEALRAAIDAAVKQLTELQQGKAWTSNLTILVNAIKRALVYLEAAQKAAT